MDSTILNQVTKLPDYSTKDLKAMWDEYFGTDVPKRQSRDFLISRLTYRIQELHVGGLSEKALKTIDHMIAADIDDYKKIKSDKPPVGTKLIRLYKGAEHQVTVLEDGFEYQGQKYRSLSKIATTITGTQWNGKTFFGLKK